MASCPKCQGPRQARSSPTWRWPHWAQVLGLAKRANMVPDGTVARPGAAARSTAGSVSFWLQFVLRPLAFCRLSSTVHFCPFTFTFHFYLLLLLFTWCLLLFTFYLLLLLFAFTVCFCFLRLLSTFYLLLFTFTFHVYFLLCNHVRSR